MLDLDWLVRRGPWQDRAACRGVKAPDVFFPDTGTSPAPARAVCKGCPVAEECLQFALAEGIREGVWGGKTATERRRLRPTKAPRQVYQYCERGLHRLIGGNVIAREDGTRGCVRCANAEAVAA